MLKIKTCLKCKGNYMKIEMFLQLSIRQKIFNDQNRNRNIQ